MLFDLDPGQASFSDVVAVAKVLRTVLEGEGLKAFAQDLRQGRAAHLRAVAEASRLRRGARLDPQHCPEGGRGATRLGNY